jgi:PBP1b-binding outer membrane lipoprotein LpoB
MFTGIKQRFTQLIVLTVVFVSCNNAEAPKQEVVDTTAASNMEAAAASFPLAIVNNKKVPTC